MLFSAASPSPEAASSQAHVPVDKEGTLALFISIGGRRGYGGWQTEAGKVAVVLISYSASQSCFAFLGPVRLVLATVYNWLRSE